MRGMNQQSTSIITFQTLLECLRKLSAIIDLNSNTQDMCYELTVKHLKILCPFVTFSPNNSLLAERLPLLAPRSAWSTNLLKLFSVFPFIGLPVPHFSHN